MFDRLGGRMKIYKVFCFDTSGTIIGFETVEASSDQEAVARAGEVQLSTRCEVWDREKLVAAIRK